MNDMSLDVQFDALRFMQNLPETSEYFREYLFVEVWCTLSHRKDSSSTNSTVLEKLWGKSKSELEIYET